jgi:hypothetical protein
MTTQEQLPQSVHPKSLGFRVLQGAGIAFTLLSILILITAGKDFKMQWLPLPLIFVTLAGAGGGVLYYLLDPFRVEGGWKKVVTNIICFLVSFVACYLSLVLALAQIGLWD